MRPHCRQRHSLSSDAASRYASPPQRGQACALNERPGRFTILASNPTWCFRSRRDLSSLGAPAQPRDAGALLGESKVGEDGAGSITPLIRSCKRTVKSAGRLLGYVPERATVIFRSLPPGAATISLMSSSVTCGSRPSVCPLSSLTTSAITRPSRAFGKTYTSAVPGRG
jgi:hypothetical protein